MESEPRIAGDRIRKSVHGLNACLRMSWYNHFHDYHPHSIQRELLNILVIIESFNRDSSVKNMLLRNRTGLTNGSNIIVWNERLLSFYVILSSPASPCATWMEDVSQSLPTGASPATDWWKREISKTWIECFRGHSIKGERNLSIV